MASWSQRFNAAVGISRKTYQYNHLGMGLRDEAWLHHAFVTLASRGWFRSYLLRCSGQPVAYLIGYQNQPRFHYIDVGYDPEYGKYHVGKVLLLPHEGQERGGDSPAARG